MKQTERDGWAAQGADGGLLGFSFSLSLHKWGDFHLGMACSIRATPWPIFGPFRVHILPAWKCPVFLAPSLWALLGNLLFFFFFLMWTNFKVLVEFVTVLRCLMFCFFRLQGIWDLSSLTRDRTCIGRRSVNYWTTREINLNLLVTYFVPSRRSHDSCQGVMNY